MGYVCVCVSGWVDGRWVGGWGSRCQSVCCVCVEGGGVGGVVIVAVCDEGECMEWCRWYVPV